jgi:hypothetical protein
MTKDNKVLKPHRIVPQLSISNQNGHQLPSPKHDAGLARAINIQTSW